MVPFLERPNPSSTMKNEIPGTFLVAAMTLCACTGTPQTPGGTQAADAASLPPATCDWPLASSTATPSVSILSCAFEMPQLQRSRRVWLYLPPGYDAPGNTARYPVLYMHDGQNVFDAATSYVGEWGVDETLDSLAAAGVTAPIVVAVDHGGERRLDEYSPWRNETFRWPGSDPDAPAAPGPGPGGEGEAYVEFLTTTLKPTIDARFRTLPGRETTGILGSSMGGLISLYAALRHPDVFGRVGVFSPAFWFAPEMYDWTAQSKAARHRANCC